MILVLNNIRSLHNVGAIFRSADATGVEEIILGGLTPTPPRAEIEKTALGATKTVPWRYQPQLVEVLKELKAAGNTIAALEQTEQSINLFSYQPKSTMVLVVGHEREGVEPEILKLCDVHLAIPMYGQSAHSLNVSTATTVALYALRLVI